jgi:hypothetical protein
LGESVRFLQGKSLFKAESREFISFSMKSFRQGRIAARARTVHPLPMLHKPPIFQSQELLKPQLPLSGLMGFRRDGTQLLGLPALWTFSVAEAEFPAVFPMSE